MEEITISDIKTNSKNPRNISEEKFNKLIKSIKDFPEMLKIRPLVIDDTNTVLGGNMRLKALLALKYTKVPVIRANTLTEAQKKEFTIKDNIGFGEWEWDTIANEWDIYKLTEWGMDMPAFVGHGEAVEDDFEMPEIINTDIVRGDLFEIFGHRLLCGDSTNLDDVKKLMNGSKADMVFTDPPYGINYSSAKETMFYSKNKKGKKRDEIKNDKTTSQYSKILPIIKENSNGVAYIFCGAGKEFDCLKAIKENGIELISTLVWNKPKGSCALAANYKPVFEMFYYCKIGKQRNWIGANNEWTVWELAEKKNNELHPTQKPVELSFRAIRNHKAEIILDFYLGSGTTMVASHQLNRKCFGMELDEKYCQVIIDRMLKIDPSIEIKKNGKKYLKSNEKQTIHA